MNMRDAIASRVHHSARVFATRTLDTWCVAWDGEVRAVVRRHGTTWTVQAASGCIVALADASIERVTDIINAAVAAHDESKLAALAETPPQPG